jgi:hypothetical protein
VSITKASGLRLYNEISAVYGTNCTYITLCGQNAGDLGLKKAVRVLISRL